MVDIHQHIVYGMDDGARSWQDTLDILLMAQEQGVTDIIATPHATPGMEPFHYAEYIQKLNQINRYAYEQNISVRLFPGAEIFYTPSTLDKLDEKAIPTLALTNAVLVEFMPDEKYDVIYGAFRKLANGGYHPVLAHVERYECLVSHIDRITELREQLEVMIQMNCRTVIKPGGLLFSRFCNRLLEGGMVDFVASDTHNCTSRPIMMREAYQALTKRFGGDMADRLVMENQLKAFPSLAE